MVAESGLFVIWTPHHLFAFISIKSSGLFVLVSFSIGLGRERGS
jgi:hypothetical protein